MPTLLAALLLLSSNALGSNVTISKGPKLESPLGYSVKWPKDYMGLRDERDNGTDTVVAYPQSYKIEFADMGDPVKIKAHKLVILNVYPNPAKTLKEVTALTEANLKNTGRQYSTRTVACGIGEASLIEVLSEPKSVSVLAVGKKAVYEFIAGDFHLPLRTMLKSLVEAKPAP
jgi:hypothetical protein